MLTSEGFKAIAKKKRINSKDKGGRGEREIIALLQPIVDRVYRVAGKLPPKLQRNSMQANGLGGCDVVGLDWLALEVKRCETLLLDQWWQQTISQAKQGAMPVLCYRQSKQPWRVRTYVWYCDKYIVADIKWIDFEYFVGKTLERIVSQ